MIIPISTARIDELHDEAIAQWGGRPGIREDGCVERSIGAARMAEFYIDGDADGPVGLCFTGALLFYLCKNSCYIDGNKRTSVLAALDMLLQYGLTLKASNDELRDYCLSIADGSVKGFEEVVRWLASQLVGAREEESERSVGQ